jgi:hypothetical protein
MNTRKHPRTLNEAFPRSASYGAAIERPAKVPLLDKIGGVALAVAIGLTLAVLLVEGLAK